MPAGRVAPGRGAAEHLRATAAEVAGLAAALVRSDVGTASLRGTKSSATDAVTDTDVRSETFIRNALRSRCPGSGVLGEELDAESGANRITWIVDPIDGTVNFLYDLPVVAVSIAASVDGTVVAGAVADVLRGEVFSAAAGHGARVGRDSIGVRSVDGLGRSLVGTGFSYQSARRAEQAAIMQRVLPSCRDIRCMGSAALNLCWVGCGRLDGYYEHDTKTYDYAAGALIAAEAGAIVELPEANGNHLSIAAHPAIFDRLRQLIAG